MLNKIPKNVGVVVLAAGQGTRLGCVGCPKVMLEIGGKPIVSYIVETLEKIGFKKEQICLVVGFEKQKVKDYFGDRVIYADQDVQEGTAHAAYVGMKALLKNIEQVLVIGGDDSAFYTSKTLEDFVLKHLESKSILSLLTVESEDQSIGRVIRNDDGEFIDVLEKEELTEEQKKIKERSTGTFCFYRKWFEKIFPNMYRIPGLEEYGLPNAVAMAWEQGVKMQAVKLKNPDEWFGINTREELKIADNRKSKIIIML